MKALPLILCSVLLHATAFAGDDEVPVMAADSGSKEVDRWVTELVSLRPAPVPHMGAKVPDEVANKLGGVSVGGPYATERVKNALPKLEEMGPAAFPFLAKHVDDDRYCFTERPLSGISNDSWNNCSVGEAVYRVIAMGLSFAGGYKFREGLDGKGFAPLGIGDYIEAQGGLETWAPTVAKKSKAEVAREVIEWCIEEEKKRGFASKEDEAKLIERYRSQLDEYR